MNWRENLRQLEQQLREHEELQLKIVLDNLLTAPEVADLLGYRSVNSFNTPHRRLSLGFPEPVKRAGRIDLWWAPDVEDWVRNRPRNHHIKEIDERGAAEA